MQVLAKDVSDTRTTKIKKHKSIKKIKNMYCAKAQFAKNHQQSVASTTGFVAMYATNGTTMSVLVCVGPQETIAVVVQDCKNTNTGIFNCTIVCSSGINLYSLHLV
jgi:hypothetical protein